MLFVGDKWGFSDCFCLKGREKKIHLFFCEPSMALVYLIMFHKELATAYIY